ncbi:MAG: DUF4336 domain-containing protein [Microcoleus sp. PH2017_25_DOB_D_A]|uniref:DUF4336 domain-containing protein n=1 Tax=unclassified Microcoleus TaxID=2642155 RepID=UPI001D443C73|nr:MULTISPECIES: DUF4336 domain-containing protein [unclassified Microcoleus]TAE13428.1 MAG: DUF4336 domain-containing protein [Oscillatoriales cyanobacterium]MCC3490775.1 DUF4336 domain-containing protein [Microcoleus sp. PH2017_16_JOR_D_A]MCC3534261.1 DUF4336 domain-containing protein [Microcoleus sp. PH2017_25_DOB_D_A]MCC3546562.1 DUF4336 domain-containing protein [Microcoleus sp. PH2017_24_DOB_U_A]TAE25330.1 MAG: DUF4336 domain-containing protein [Oscillatoriales cyanobacterium]
MLREIDRDIWVAEQPLRYFGLSVGTRMTVIRLANRELVVISPIQVNDTIVSQLSEQGTVSHIIAPNLYHYLFAANFKKLYPNAKFWAAPGLEAKKPDLAIDRTIQGEANSLWNGLEYVFFDGFRTLSLSGFDSLNECVFFHAASRTLILTDTAFHFDESFPIITQFASRAIGGYKNLSPSILERIATKDKEKVRESVKKVLGWDFERVIVAHGSIIETQGKQKFKEGYEQFLGCSVNV